MTERLVVVGAGGFGRETLDVIEAQAQAGAAIELVGVIDSGPADTDLARLAERGVAYLGTESEWIPTARGDERFVVGIGSPDIREAVDSRWMRAGFSAATLVHPRAVLGSQVTVGEGSIITSGVQVSTNVAVGRHVHLNPGAIIGHDAILQDFVSVNPGAVVSGNVRVLAQTLLGAGSIVLQGLSIGPHAIVGASACVTKDVSADITVVGVPARSKESM
ncbi:NeuD/PglB/VioB family sugar acetyltransferase [Microbacterium sp. NPDC089318]